MAKAKTTTTIEYPTSEFIELIREKIFSGNKVDVKFVIEEVGGDPMDRWPGQNKVTKVNVEFDGVPSELGSKQ